MSVSNCHDCEPEREPDCPDVGGPHVDESAEECCGIYPTNCVVMSKQDNFLGTGKGEYLTKVVQVISSWLKKLDIRTRHLNYNELTALISQVGTALPTLFIVSNGFKDVTYVVSTAGAGDFLITASEAIFKVNQTHHMCPSPSPQLYGVELFVVSTTELAFKVYDPSAVLTDGLIRNAPLMVKIKR